MVVKIIVLILTVALVVLSAHRAPKDGGVRHVTPINATLAYESFPTGTYQRNITNDLGDELVEDDVVAGKNIYNVIRPKPVGKTKLVLRKQKVDSMIVPDLNNANTRRSTVWDGVRIGVATDRASVALHQPLYGEVVIENENDHQFIIRSGCVSDMEFVIPKIYDSQRRSITDLFPFGPHACAATFEYAIPADTTTCYLFNINDLYEVSNPRRYTMPIILDNCIIQNSGNSNGMPSTSIN